MTGVVIDPVAVADRDIASIEAQLVRLLKGAGKVRRPRKGGLSRALTVESPAQETIHVTVSEDRGKAAVRARGYYSVLIEEARGADYRVVRRAKAFAGLRASLTTDEREKIFEAVVAHLAVKDASSRERARGELEKATARDVSTKQFQAMAKRHGLPATSANYRCIFHGPLTVTREPGDERFELRVTGLTEADVDRILPSVLAKPWKKK